MIARVGEVAYKLQLPPESKFHPVFHVSQLKRTLGKATVPIAHLPLVDSNGNFKVEPVAVLARRLIPIDNKAVTQVLIQWSNSLPEDATWEDLLFIQAHYPLFHP